MNNKNISPSRNKLYIIGAGSSRDINANMPLGKDIISHLANLRTHLYYELIYVVLIKNILISISSDYIYNSDIDDLVLRFIDKKYDFLQTETFNEQIGLADIIEEFCNEFFNLPSHFNILPEVRTLIISKVKSFFINDSYDNSSFFSIIEEFFHYFRQYNINNHTLDSDFKESCKNFLTEIRRFLDFILPSNSNDDNFNRELYEIYYNYFVSGLILYNLIHLFDGNIYSIDHIMNFIDTITPYNDKLANKYDLPKVNSVRNYAKYFLLKFIRSTPDNFFINEHNWISFIFKQIFLDNGKKTKSNFKNIDFIIFNYDKYIQRYFRQMPLGKSQDSIRELIINKLDNAHIYGQTCPGYGKSVHYFFIHFNIMMHKINYKNHLNQEIQNHKNSIEKIDFIRVFKDSKLINNYFKKIIEAREIYFIGFGFDEWNLHNIGIYDKEFNVTNESLEITNKTIYATNVGDLPKIRLTLEKIFGVKLYKESERIESSGNGNKKIYSFWRSNDISNRQNNVYVSTKPLYKAMNEDFL